MSIGDYKSKRTSLTLMGFYPYLLTVLAFFTFNAVCASAEDGGVTQERILTADANLTDWLVHGRTFEDQRYTPARKITKSNIGQLGLAWSTAIPSEDGLVPATIAVDGVLYISSPLSVVYALDAKTGEIKWSYDPEIALGNSFAASLGSRVNRGVAVWGDKVIVGTGDCRLIALHADTGKPVWESTACDVKQGYYKNAAPRVGGGMVFSGTSGSEVGVRGYLDAHDVDTGDHLWRFYTVPKNQGEQENEILEMAAKTWKGEESISGGTVWDAVTYDAELELVYFGTAGAFPTPPVSHEERGDELFLESVIAVDAKSGEYVWHYQTTPKDHYDFNANFHLMLADLSFEGRERKVLMTAPKNGYFYTLDRATGELLSIGALTRHINWADEIDEETGRPTWNKEILRENMAPGECEVMFPGGWGAHNWHAMSYSPEDQLVYLPVTNVGDKICGDGSRVTLVPEGESAGYLVAWDPVEAEVRWRVPRVTAYNGGAMTTGAGIVFEGTGDGLFQALASDTGEILWTYDIGTAIAGPPISIVLDGEQYVIVPAGNSGVLETAHQELTTAPDAVGPARMLAFKLGGKVQLPDNEKQPARLFPEPPDMKITDEQVNRGRELFVAAACSTCHGPGAVAASGHSIPDLRYLTRERHRIWDAVVIGGLLRDKGMMPMSLEVGGTWVDELTLDDSRSIQAYIVNLQIEAYRKQETNKDETDLMKQ